MNIILENILAKKLPRKISTLRDSDKPRLAFFFLYII